MLVWLTLPFYDFCGFRSVAFNIVYKTAVFLHLFPVLVKLELFYIGKVSHVLVLEWQAALNMRS